MADEFADIWDEEGTDLDVAIKSSQRAEDKLFKVIKGLIFITLDVATKPLRVTVVDILYFPSLCPSNVDLRITAFSSSLQAGFRESAADEDDGRFESGFRAGFKEAITRGLYWGQLKGKAQLVE